MKIDDLVCQVQGNSSGYHRHPGHSSCCQGPHACQGRNHLPSGTAAAVKVHMTAKVGTIPSAQWHSSCCQGPHAYQGRNYLPSGTAAAVKVHMPAKVGTICLVAQQRMSRSTCLLRQEPSAQWHSSCCQDPRPTCLPRQEPSAQWHSSCCQGPHACQGRNHLHCLPTI